MCIYWGGKEEVGMAGGVRAVQPLLRAGLRTRSLHTLPEPHHHTHHPTPRQTRCSGSSTRAPLGWLRRPCCSSSSSCPAGMRFQTASTGERDAGAVPVLCRESHGQPGILPGCAHCARVLQDRHHQCNGLLSVTSALRPAYSWSLAGACTLCCPARSSQSPARRQCSSASCSRCVVSGWRLG